MVKRKVSELSGAALDYAVAKAQGMKAIIDLCSSERVCYLLGASGEKKVLPYRPSSDWGQGGEIISRERIAIDPYHDFPNWAASGPVPKVFIGDTALIAAMRCFVASKLGAEVEIPAELT